VQTNCPPIVRADQTHRMSVGDRPSTAVAGLLEAGTAPHFNRAAATREMARLYPLSDELPGTIGVDQHEEIDIMGLPMEQRFSYSGYRCQAHRLTSMPPSRSTVAAAILTLRIASG